MIYINLSEVDNHKFLLIFYFYTISYTFFGSLNGTLLCLKIIKIDVQSGAVYGLRTPFSGAKRWF